MSTLELKVPIAQGQPGLIIWIKTMAQSASAIDCATVPAKVMGDMAPANVNGVTIVGCPQRDKRISPSNMGKSCLSGEVELILVNIRGVCANSCSVKPPAMRTISMTSLTRPAPSE